MRKNGICLFLLLLPALLLSQESGRLDITYQNQTFQTSSDGLSSLSTFNSFFISFWQKLDHAGFLNFSLNYLPSESDNRVPFYYLSLSEVRLGKFHLSAELGNTAFRLSSLLPFDSFNTSDFLSLQGVSLALESERASYYLFSGQLYQNFFWGPGQQKRALLSGIKGVFRPLKGWTVGTGYLRVTRLPEMGPTPSTTSADILTLDSSAEISRDFHLLSDYKIALPSADRSGLNYSLKIGPHYRSQKFSLELYYNYITPEFPLFERILRRDTQGLTFIGEIRPFTRLSLFGSVDTFNENLERAWTRPFNDYLTFSSGASMSLPGLPTLSLRFSTSQRQSETAGVTTADNRFNSFFLSLFKYFRYLLLNVRYQRGDYNDSLQPAQAMTMENYSLEARKMFLDGSAIYINTYLSRQNSPGNYFRSDLINLQAGAFIRLKPELNVNGQLSFNASRINTSDFQNLGFGAEAGINYLFRPWRINLSLYYRYGYTGTTVAESLQTNYHQVYFSVTKSFGWGKATANRQASTFADLFRRKGKISGVLFIDANQNGRRDPDEETLADVAIFLDGHLVTASAKDGSYLIPAIEPGQHLVSVDMGNIPVYYMPAGREEKEITVRSGKTEALDVAFIPVGLIIGRLFVDENENGRADADEPPLADIPIILRKDAQAVTNTVTNSRGLFRFNNLPAGEYLIEVDGHLPEGYVVSEQSHLTVPLQPKQEKRDAVLLVRRSHKPVVKKDLSVVEKK